MTVATTAAGQAGVENQAGRDAGQPQNDTTDDQHNALADAATNRAESASSRGSRTHGSGTQVAQAPQESGRIAHIPTHLAVAPEGTHTHADQEAETSVAPKPSARAAQAIAAFQVASMANMLGVVFVLGVRLAMPLIVALLVVEVAMGLIARAAPGINLQVVSQPLRILVGLLVIASIISMAPGLIGRYITPSLELGMRGALAFR